MKPKFKVGDQVVVIGPMGLAMGRPKIKTIEMIQTLEDGSFRYCGGSWKNVPKAFGDKPRYTWFIQEKSLVLASEYTWPSEFEMRLMDKKFQKSFDDAFEHVANHHNEDK